MSDLDSEDERWLRTELKKLQRRNYELIIMKKEFAKKLDKRRTRSLAQSKKAIISTIKSHKKCESFINEAN